MKVKIKPSYAKGEVTPPPSKSMLHRAIICASLAYGKSIINNVNYSNDINSTISAFEALGVNIIKNKTSLIIESNGNLKFTENIKIDCSESGSTLRFLIPIVTNNSYSVTLTGAKSLFSRPLSVYEKIYKENNLTFNLHENNLIVKGSLVPNKYFIEGNISSQFISGLLFALPLLEETSEIIILNTFESKDYVKMTVSMLQNFGIKIIENENGYIIPGKQKYKPNNIIIESDYSQMAFFAAAGVINGDVICKNMNFNSLQGDKRIVDIIYSLGGKIKNDNDTYTFQKSNLKATTVDVSQCPDLAPILSVILALSKGTSKIINAKRLVLKESNRLLTSYKVLKQLGVYCEIIDDSLIIKGVDIFNGGVFNSFNDHRIAMMIAIAALRAKEDIIIENFEAINKSYPDFFQDLADLGIKILFI